MPKFGERETDRIRKCLIERGEQLFLAHGLKKVTVDELAREAGIAKATFYRFFPGKEDLFLEIAMIRRKEIFCALETVLKRPGSDREKVYSVFYVMSELMSRYPILSTIDSEIEEAVRRRASQERLESFQKQGLDAVGAMIENGIRFRYPQSVVTAAFEALYQAWIGMQDKPLEVKKQAINLLLDGLLDRLLENER